MKLKLLAVVQKGGQIQSLRTNEILETFGEKPLGDFSLLPGQELKLGAARVTRASNVVPSEVGHGWDVILTNNPLNGAHAGKVIAINVPTRAEAIAYEVAYIERNIFGAAPNE